MIYLHKLEEMHIQPAGDVLTDKACPHEHIGAITGFCTAAGMNDTGLLSGRKKED